MMKSHDETSLRIAIIGPESTGKSTLCSHLAKYYNSVWVPEYAREHLEHNGLVYNYDDLLVIARNQVALEDRMVSVASGKPVFIDTNLYVMKVWCEYVFNKCHWWIMDEIVKRKYDLYLLCDIDLPWEYQPMREYPDFEARRTLFHMYRDIMINQKVPWELVHGTDEQRFVHAVNIISTSFDPLKRYSSMA